MEHIFKTHYTLLLYLAKFFLERKMFQTKQVEKIKAHFTFDFFFFFSKIVPRAR